MDNNGELSQQLSNQGVLNIDLLHWQTEIQALTVEVEGRCSCRRIGCSGVRTGCKQS